MESDSGLCGKKDYKTGIWLQVESAHLMSLA